MPLLNDDVLRRIVGYMSSEELQQVNSCHPLFFEEWMRNRYCSLAFTKRDKEMKRLLRHLVNPQVAYYVKKVEIRPWLVQPRTKTPQSITENLLVHCLKVIDPHYTKKLADQRLQKRLDKDTINVMAAFEKMSRVEEYTIDWDESVGHHKEFFSGFLTPVLKSWSTQLVKLTIKVPPPILNKLATVKLPKLETFVFHFSTGSLSHKDIVNTHDGFIVFTNNLKDSLQHLTLISTRTSEDLDVSNVIRKIGQFPSLRKITLSIPFDGGHLSQPMEFVRFLEKHRSTLWEIDISTSLLCVRNKPGDPDYVNWIQRILGSIHTPFPQLRSVALPLRPLRAPLDVFNHFFDIHASTLDSVVFTERALSPSDLTQLFSSWRLVNCSLLGESITTLQFKTEEFSARFLSVIANLFPSLKTLKIEFTNFVIHDRRLKARNLNLHHIPEFSADLEAYRHIFAEWELRSLAVGPLDHWAQMIQPDLQTYLPRVHVTDFQSS